MAQARIFLEKYSKWGLGKTALVVKSVGGLASATIGVVAESVITGKPPTVESVLKSSVVAVAYVLGGPVGGIIASTVIIAAENGLFDDIENPFSNLSSNPSPSGAPSLQDQALSQPTGPAAAYSRALAHGTPQEIARAAMNLPEVYDDAILRAAAGYGVYDRVIDNDRSSKDKGRSGHDDHDPGDNRSHDNDKNTRGSRHDDDHGGGKGGKKDTGGHGNDTGRYGGGGKGGKKDTGGHRDDRKTSDKKGSDDDKNSRPDRSPPENDPDTTGPRPILLDLDGNGIEITDLTKSTQFVDATGDGLQNRTAWAGAGDGVLFYDPDNLNAIVEKRQYVFTEWDPTATSDMEALASYFDSNGDGVLDASDAEFANFKVLVTNADGSTTAMTLAQLNITSINLTADATHIELPDGSMTGETIFIPNNNSAGKSTQSLGGYQ